VSSGNTQGADRPENLRQLLPVTYHRRTLRRIPFPDELFLDPTHTSNVLAIHAAQDTQGPTAMIVEGPAFAGHAHHGARRLERVTQTQRVELLLPPQKLPFHVQRRGEFTIA